MGREPTVEEYVEAFSECEYRMRGRLKILKAHYESPDHISTATLLAEAVGYVGYKAVNLHYGELGKILCAAMGISPIDYGEPDDPVLHCYLKSLVTFEPPQEKNGHWKLILRPNVVRAIEELGWFGPEGETEETA